MVCEYRTHMPAWSQQNNIIRKNILRVAATLFVKYLQTGLGFCWSDTDNNLKELSTPLNLFAQH